MRHHHEWQGSKTLYFVFFMMVRLLVVEASLAADGLSQPCEECGSFGNSSYPTMSPIPTSNPRGNVDWGVQSSGGIDFLVAAFFLIAAGWLVLALFYSVLVLIVLRLRARGELDIYDENFGRIFLIGQRCYIPLGCILRRYVIALHNEQDSEGNPANIRFMTREERRTAMEVLLASDHAQENTPVPLEATTPEPALMGSEEERAPRNEAEEDNEDQSTDAPVCSICLMEYEENDVCFSSSTCPHRFHRECILDWLERRANTECPCCRVPLVDEEEVWDSVERIRRERRKQNQMNGRASRILCCLCCCQEEKPGVEASASEAAASTGERPEGGVALEQARLPTESPTEATSGFEGCNSGSSDHFDVERGLVTEAPTTPLVSPQNDTSNG